MKEQTIAAKSPNLTAGMFLVWIMVGLALWLWTGDWRWTLTGVGVALTWIIVIHAVFEFLVACAEVRVNAIQKSQRRSTQW